MTSRVLRGVVLPVVLCLAAAVVTLCALVDAYKQIERAHELDAALRCEGCRTTPQSEDERRAVATLEKLDEAGLRCDADERCVLWREGTLVDMACARQTLDDQEDPPSSPP